MDPEKGPPLVIAVVVAPSSIEAAFFNLQKGPVISLCVLCDTSKDLLKITETSDTGASLVPTGMATKCSEIYNAIRFCIHVDWKK